MFVPDAQLTVGTQLAFSYDLADGRCVLVGLGVVHKSHATTANRFGRAGAVLTVLRVSPDTKRVIEQMTAMRASEQASPFWLEKDAVTRVRTEPLRLFAQQWDDNAQTTIGATPTQATRQPTATSTPPQPEESDQEVTVMTEPPEIVRRIATQIAGASLPQIQTPSRITPRQGLPAQRKPTTGPMPIARGSSDAGKQSTNEATVATTDQPKKRG